MCVIVNAVRYYATDGSEHLYAKLCSFDFIGSDARATQTISGLEQLSHIGND
jgi:hypothetical protein